MTTSRGKCFVMMPISDSDGYEEGHFDRVYEFIFKPACEQANFEVHRVDKTVASNHIAIEILQNILHADICLCDTSGKNPNVMYELGIRQAFDKPTVLVKDTRTSRIFDTSWLRDIQYDESLRIDTVNAAVKKISAALIATFDATEGVNSLVKLLEIEPATISKTELTPEQSFIVESLRDISRRIDNIESCVRPAEFVKIATRKRASSESPFSELPNGELVRPGDDVFVRGDRIGQFVGYTAERTLIIRSESKSQPFLYTKDDPHYMEVTRLPF